MPMYEVNYKVFDSNFSIGVFAENVDEATTLVENMNVIELLKNKNLSQCGGSVFNLTKIGHKPL
jgi:hypothetical protein